MPARTLYRLAGWAGAVSAAILVINAARRGHLIPDNLPVTHALAPLAEAFGLLLLTGLFLAAHQRTGALGTLGYTLNFLGLAGLLGVEYILNLVFPELTKAQITTLTNGLTGTMFTATSIIFLAGAIIFGATLWQTKQTPRAAVAAYVLGAIPVALRGVLPAATFPPGVLVMAVGIAWMGITLIKHAPRSGPQDTGSKPSAPPVGSAGRLAKSSN